MNISVSTIDSYLRAPALMETTYTILRKPQKAKCGS